MEALKLITTYLFKEKVLHNKLQHFFFFYLFLCSFLRYMNQNMLEKISNHLWSFSHCIGMIKKKQNSITVFPERAISPVESTGYKLQTSHTLANFGTSGEFPDLQRGSTSEFFSGNWIFPDTIVFKTTVQVFLTDQGSGCSCQVRSKFPLAQYPVSTGGKQMVWRSKPKQRLYLY